MNPLSGLYGAGIALRNRLFDRRVLPVLRLARPVVSVGNLSAGGAGKTPFVIALGELLKQRGISFDVLSRGYGRKTRGVRVVDPAGSASEYGDEPLLIARSLRVPVVVGESRYQAGRIAEEQFPTGIHLLDDGFQHRSLARDFDIVLLATGDFEDRLLPVGRLREAPSALGRADMIVIPHGFAIDISALSAKPVWRVTREIEIAASAPESPPPDNRPIVFCGIARPQQFFAMVRGAGVEPAEEVAFRDHHAYDASDIRRLRTMRDQLGAGGFLTTEKDVLNLGPLRSSLESLAIAKLRVSIDRPEELVDTILARIAGRKPHS
jgi:tetraacyldisaccharide 4'-kinase